MRHFCRALTRGVPFLLVLALSFHGQARAAGPTPQQLVIGGTQGERDFTAILSQTELNNPVNNSKAQQTPAVTPTAPVGRAGIELPDIPAPIAIAVICLVVGGLGGYLLGKWSKDSRVPILGLIPPEYRLPALIVLGIEGVLALALVKPESNVRIFAIIIMGTVAVAGLLLFFIFTIRTAPPRVDSVQVEEQAEKIAKTFEDELLKRYGVRADCVSVTIEILDLDGTSRITSSWEGIKVAPGVQISHFPGEDGFNTPGVKFTKPTTLIRPVDFR